MTDSDPVPFGAPGVRIGTAERERAAAALGEHFAAGRLEVDEYDERVARVYAAKTTADLAALFDDLPRPAPPPPAPPPVMPAVGRAPVLPAAVVFLAVVVAVAVVATTHFLPFVLIPVLFAFWVRGRRGPRYRGRRYHGSRYYRM
jgi:hypothetical protein